LVQYACKNAYEYRANVNTYRREAINQCFGVEMTLTGLLLLLLIAGVVGVLGQAISAIPLAVHVHHRRFCGAYVGIWLARQLRLPKSLPSPSKAISHRLGSRLGDLSLILGCSPDAAMYKQRAHGVSHDLDRDQIDRRNESFTRAVIMS
jgi:hypothetical protein